MRGEKCKIQPKQTWSSNVKTPLVLTYLWFCKNKRNSRTEQHVSLAMIASQTSFLQWTDTTQRKCANFIYVRSLFCQGRGPRPAFQATIDSFISSLALIHIVQAQFSSNTFAQLWFCFLVFFWKRHVGSLISSNLSPSFFDNPVGGWRLNTRHPQRLFGPNTMHAASAAFMWGWIIPLRPVSRQEFPPGSPFLPTSGSLSLFFFFFFSCPLSWVIFINLQCNICESLFISPFSLSLSLSLSLCDLVSAHWAYTGQPSLSRSQMFRCALWSRWLLDNRWSLLPGDEPSGKKPGIVSEPWQTPHSHKKMKTYTQKYFCSDFLWILFSSYHFIFSQLGE